MGAVPAGSPTALLLLSAAVRDDGTGHLSPLLPVLSRLRLPLGTLPHFAGFECMHLTGGA